MFATSMSLRQPFATSTTSIDEEAQLIAASQAGDVEAFNCIVRRYERRVFGLCYRMLDDKEAAADTTQDVFWSAYRHIRSFHGNAFSSWLLRIAANACYDVLRARKRRPTTSLDMAWDDEDAPSLDIADSGECPDDVALRHELGATIQRALSQIPAEQRLVVVMSDVQGMGYDEIATATGLALGTVKSRISRGRARLRDLLKAMLNA